MQKKNPFRLIRQGALSAALATSAFFAAAQSTPPAQTETPASGQTTPAGPARVPFVVAKFTQFVNTKNAKPGDAVKAKTIADLKLGDIDIPKGSVLQGAVTEAQSEKDGNGTAALAIRFDHIDLKSGQTLKIAGQIIAIGEVTNDPGLGTGSVLGRGGVGSTQGLDPNLDLGNTKKGDIGLGSSMPGVAIGLHLDQNQATQLRGIKREIKIDTDTEIKVALYRQS